MICNKCNHKLPDDSEFCQYCGNKIEKVDDIVEVNTVSVESSIDNLSSDKEINDILKIQAKNTIEAMEKNKKEQPDNESDEDFGLVPYKPIFTHALQTIDGEKEYLNGLRTDKGEKIKYDRRGSISIEGINGMIDIYETFLPSGQPYKTIYINMYGAKTSPSAPQGFILIGDKSKSPKPDKMKSTKQKKRINKKLIACLITIPISLAILTLLVVMLLIPALKYNHAKKLLENGNYELAYSEFLALEDYSNSKEMLLETRYLQAAKYRDAGDFELSNKIFDSLGDYRDSKILIHEHTYKLSETITATCTVKGNNTYKCEGCGFTYSEEIDSLSHNYIVISSEFATCLKEGFNNYKCSLCGDEYSETLGISKHDYVISSTQNSTCQAVGAKNYTCSSCGNSYSEEISKLSHSYASATCTTAKTCTMCGTTSGDALGHSGGVVCSRCGIVTFETLTYSGMGYKSIKNINVPKGNFIVSGKAYLTNGYAGSFYMYLNNGDGDECAYWIESLYSNRQSIEKTVVFEGPVNVGILEIEADDNVNWTITIEAIG